MNIGLVGVGNMGGAMALRLLDAGHAVHVCDIDAARVQALVASGARAHRSAAALASACELAIVVVVDAAQTAEVLFGHEGVMAAATLPVAVMLCPTIAPADTEAFAARLQSGGVGAFDAPMSGGPLRARDGSMSLMVAAPDAFFERYAAVLQTLSSRLFRVGTRIGDGARTKLVNNLLATINLAGAAEVMALAQSVGLDAQKTLDVIEQSSGQSWIGSDRMRRALVGDLAPKAHMALLRKDSALALAMAAQHGAVNLAVGTQAAALFERACQAGLADADDASMLPFLRPPEP